MAGSQGDRPLKETAPLRHTALPVLMARLDLDALKIQADNFQPVTVGALRGIVGHVRALEARLVVVESIAEELGKLRKADYGRRLRDTLDWLDDDLHAVVRDLDLAHPYRDENAHLRNAEATS